MRSIGYEPRTAIADLVDNSVAAGARNVHVEIQPADGGADGFVSLRDDGSGMAPAELLKAMRWGGDGPKAKRAHKDLGRFGLGMKTASFSLGRRLTVISRRDGVTSVWRWDLDHVEAKGWQLQCGLDPLDQELHAAIIDPVLRQKRDGTLVLVTKVDRLRIDGYSSHYRNANKTSLLTAVRDHLGLVFHRFTQSKQVALHLGATVVPGWNLLGSAATEETCWLKSSETIGAAAIRSFVLPHPKSLTDEQQSSLAGPLGWNAHQGFLVYRGDRLIVPGGWLGFARPEEYCKLARIAVDLPNSEDEAWGLNVMKSKVVVPAVWKAEFERIASAARRGAMDAWRFHGEKVAPSVDHESEEVPCESFWKQVTGKKDVHYRINPAHPLAEALVQSISDKQIAAAFLRAFERLLPISAILQQPHKSVHALAATPEGHELDELAVAAQLAVEVYTRTGFVREEAIEKTLSCQPFSNCRDLLLARLGKPHTTLLS